MIDVSILSNARSLPEPFDCLDPKPLLSSWAAWRCRCSCRKLARCLELCAATAATVAEDCQPLRVSFSPPEISNLHLTTAKTDVHAVSLSTYFHCAVSKYYRNHSWRQGVDFNKRFKMERDLPELVLIELMTGLGKVPEYRDPSRVSMVIKE